MYGGAAALGLLGYYLYRRSSSEPYRQTTSTTSTVRRTPVN